MLGGSAQEIRRGGYVDGEVTRKVVIRAAGQNFEGSKVRWSRLPKRY